jgi:hypothetical protein
LPLVATCISPVIIPGIPDDPRNRVEESNDERQFKRGAFITRDAREALFDLKKLIDGAAEKIRVAEKESVTLAIGRTKGG